MWKYDFCREFDWGFDGEDEEAAEWLADYVGGEELGLLGVREYTIEDYISQNKCNLEKMDFTVWYETKHKGGFNRESVCSLAFPLFLLDPNCWKEHIVESYGEDCLGYLDELAHVGMDGCIYKFLMEQENIDNLLVGASHELHYVFHPIPAKTWLEWYNFVEIEDTTDSECCLLYDQWGRFAEYPFPGKSIYPEYVKYQKRYEQRKTA
jgi:hypothetical protein